MIFLSAKDAKNREKRLEEFLRVASRPSRIEV